MELRAFLATRPTLTPSLAEWVDSFVRVLFGGGAQTFTFMQSDSYSASTQESLLAQGTSAQTRGWDYSSTNIQVQGVDESDAIKTDGTYIYTISENQLIIVKAYPAVDVEVVARIRLAGEPAGLFINGNMLVLLETANAHTTVALYDIMDRAHPIRYVNASLDGHYFDSRMIGDFVYVIVNKPAQLEDSTVTLPQMCVNHRVEATQASDVYY